MENKKYTANEHIRDLEEDLRIVKKQILRKAHDKSFIQILNTTGCNYVGY